MTEPAEDWTEQGVVFPCQGEALVGVVSRPARPGPLGLIILVGGPQYRVGAHRQFVHLARALAAEGVASLRFDFRGMGDASGAERTFRRVNDDVAAAVDALEAAVPDLEGVVLWGLCGGASAACLYGPHDPRVKGLVLVNPWLTAETTAARVFVRHYYLKRVVSPAFWRKMLAGRVAAGRSVRDLVTRLAQARGRGNPAGGGGRDPAEATDPLPDQVLRALAHFRGRTVVQLSGDDYVARTFEAGLMRTAGFQALTREEAVLTEHFPEDDHTFSGPGGRERLAQAAARWVHRLAAT
ncbi:hydrolase 1, exosortase A system-associated [Alkalilimnicola ehrlichii]|uniref:hydrolase 1, exosortase A system-associated n=1 Tax=Alkalilimnicola ehrlichii TaxID=351052 RepID=UPI003BA28069